MSGAPMADRPQLAIDAFGYWHLLILLGVIAIAMGLKKATGHPFDPLPHAQAIALGGGAAVFLFGESLFRRTLSMGAARGRAVVGVLALATIPIGTELAATAQLGALVALFVVMLIAADAGRRAGEPSA